MSHFIGLVFLRDGADLDTTLEPFDEQNEEYMEFQDKTDEVKEEYAKLPDSVPSEGTFTEEIDRTELVNKVWEEAPDELTKEQEESFWKPYNKKDFPTPTAIAENKGYEVVEDAEAPNGVRFIEKEERRWEYTPSKEKYPTIKDFADRWFGYRKVNGRFGYMHNPNAKYDWYQTGGRWAGYILNKEGKETDEEYLTEVDWERMFQPDDEGYDHIPFCYVNDEGEWCEKGKMGWLCMTADEKPKDTWNEEFKSYVEKLLTEPDASEIEVVAVDFHI